MYLSIEILSKFKIELRYYHIIRVDYGLITDIKDVFKRLLIINRYFHFEMTLTEGL